ncbi:MULTISPECIES: PfkB family carbohydrate kinase [Symbiopectobacterium]|uniref:PfkB family carbohydrate kinase n=1 Tax=Symbiopectobacterium TaxID=801 RepID=UPI001A209D17|nr:MULTISPECIES: PfkB family carbohydrate kinase [Symbiopectobacterium]MBG6249173.1 DeoR family transcriptional regulator [Candidatus Symbiopectobacterium sp. PLON1]MBT9430498.1 bifunctional hydroxymethylpyrimidine kinase/phosphomethylpyrimidine kinase [Candidatus Symbiopectobacterium endolongispinus]
MFLEERRNQILAYLTKHERASVDYLATEFAVSKETIRSDLNELARLNLVQRCYGGAIIVRRSLQSGSIAPRSENFEVLLKRLEKQTRHQTSKQKGNKMNGKVCILGSFNVDIVAKVAHALGKKVILNPAPYSSEILPYLDYLDVITPNETEASLLSGIDIQDFDSTKEAALKIARMGAKRVIITMGSRGALLYDGHQFQHIPAFPALGVDTTGAGDAFNGAFAAALANGQSMVQAATYDSAFASLAVEREGASNMPEHQQVIARLSQR